MRSGTIKMRLARVIDDFQTGKSRFRKIGNQTASPLLLKQAATGNAAAQYRLACCYTDGNDLTQDPTTACMWFQKAADAGHVPAMVRLGEAYLDGEGVDRNRVRGLFWLLTSANRGSRDACAHLGIRYLNGDRLPKRGDLAAKWLKVAADRGCVSSMLGLAFCYRGGIGIEQNPVRFLVCLAVASVRSGDKMGFISNRSLTVGLTDEQFLEVQCLSAKMINGGPLDL